MLHVVLRTDLRRDKVVVASRRLGIIDVPALPRSWRCDWSPAQTVYRKMRSRTPQSPVAFTNLAATPLGGYTAQEQIDAVFGVVVVQDFRLMWDRLLSYKTTAAGLRGGRSVQQWAIVCGNLPCLVLSLRELSGTSACIRDLFGASACIRDERGVLERDGNMLTFSMRGSAASSRFLVKRCPELLIPEHQAGIAMARGNAQGLQVILSAMSHCYRPRMKHKIRGRLFLGDHVDCLKVLYQDAPRLLDISDLLFAMKAHAYACVDFLFKVYPQWDTDDMHHMAAEWGFPQW